MNFTSNCPLFLDSNGNIINTPKIAIHPSGLAIHPSGLLIHPSGKLIHPRTLSPIIFIGYPIGYAVETIQEIRQTIQPNSGYTFVNKQSNYPTLFSNVPSNASNISPIYVTRTKHVSLVPRHS
jgi:hypothetical protein